MYSMVLMAALTATPDAAGFGYGCLGGCGGCTGTVVSVGCGGCGGCTGTASCFGSSCYGGGRASVFPLFPRVRARLAGVFGGGCYSSCHGSACYGSSCYSSSCYGSSCYSSACYGSGCHSSSCYGSGCYSSGVSACYGSSCTGSACFGSASYGTSYHSPTPFGYGSGSCFGTGGAVHYGADFHQPLMGTPVIGSGIIDGLGSAAPSVPTITIDHSAEYRAAQSKPAAAPARLTVELPATAKLYVDGNLVNGDSTSRNFHTPELPAGKTFYYELKAEVVVDGKVVTEAKRVLVKAGDANSESFEKLIAAVKSDKTDVAKK